MNPMSNIDPSPAAGAETPEAEIRAFIDSVTTAMDRIVAVRAALDRLVEARDAALARAKPPTYMGIPIVAVEPDANGWMTCSTCGAVFRDMIHGCPGAPSEEPAEKYEQFLSWFGALSKQEQALFNDIRRTPKQGAPLGETHACYCGVRVKTLQGGLTYNLDDTPHSCPRSRWQPTERLAALEKTVDALERHDAGDAKEFKAINERLIALEKRLFDLRDALK